MNKLVIFKGLQDDEIIKSFLAKDFEAVAYKLSLELGKKPLPAPVFASYVLDKIMVSEHLFAVESSKNIRIVPKLYQAVVAEIEVIQKNLLSYEEPEWLSACGAGFAGDSGDEYYLQMAQNFEGWLTKPAKEVVDILKAFHNLKGFGPLVRHRVWRWQGHLVGVASPDPITLDDLIGYEYQKQQVVQNTRLLLDQNRGNNVLLYGERGTGKSSLIKAVANHFGAEGLSLIEVPRSYLIELPKILDLVKHQPQHYILFIDDLSFDGADHDYKELKAILEGGVEALSGHVLLYATSNRRHLVSEEWKDRAGVQHIDGELRLGDTMSEKLSLADRFGLTMTFSSPDQEQYLDIVYGIAQSEGIKMDPEELRVEAIKWARWQNSPSGRTARQFINSLMMPAKE